MKRIIFAFVCVWLTVSLVACSTGSGRSAEDILYEICNDMELPAGSTYLSAAEEGSEKYLSDHLIESLYGKKAKEENFSLIEDYAIYLSSFAAPYEVAIFKCFSSSDTDTVASMCLQRADVLAVVLRDTGFSYLSERVNVTVRGHFVVMLVAEDIDLAEEVVLKAIG